MISYKGAKADIKEVAKDVKKYPKALRTILWILSILFILLVIGMVLAFKSGYLIWKFHPIENSKTIEVTSAYFSIDSNELKLNHTYNIEFDVTAKERIDTKVVIFLKPLSKNLTSPMAEGYENSCDLRENLHCNLKALVKTEKINEGYYNICGILIAKSDESIKFEYCDERRIIIS